MRTLTNEPLTHEHLETCRMPGHWLLARLGKQVLRPGGRELTEAMLADVGVGETDDVVELAPGAGATAHLLLASRPHSYVAVDQDAEVVERLARALDEPQASTRTGAAHDTGLAAGSASVVVAEAMLTMNPDAVRRRIVAEAFRVLAPAGLAAGSASVVVAEAMLTMNPDAMRRRIVAEAFRVLAPGGRYAVHELALVPDDLPQAERQRIARDLSTSIHVGAKPLPAAEWRALLEDAGFVVEAILTAPMSLLELGRFVRDEGLWGTARFAVNLARDRAALARVWEMRDVFRRHASHLGAIALVARKPAGKEV